MLFQQNMDSSGIKLLLAAFSLPAFHDPAHQDRSERIQFNPLTGRNEMTGGLQPGLTSAWMRDG